MHHARHPRWDVSSRLQQCLPHRADSRLRHHPLRDDPQRAHHSSGRQTTSLCRRQIVGRGPAWTLGRQYVGHRHDQLQQQRVDRDQCRYRPYRDGEPQVRRDGSEPDGLGPRAEGSAPETGELRSPDSAPRSRMGRAAAPTSSTTAPSTSGATPWRRSRRRWASAPSSGWDSRCRWSRSRPRPRSSTEK